MLVTMASLVADYGSSSNSDSDSDSDSDSVTEKTEKEFDNTSEKLPRPEFGTGAALGVKNSVFSNPFVEAEEAKKAILEKHVKMTPTKDEIKMINGKKICWNFRKGRCRFGHKCKFAHDSDLQVSNSEVPCDSDVTNSEEVLPSLPNTVVPIVDEEIDNDSENTNSVNKKKRPGLCQTLIPGKKVMKMFKKQKSADASQVTSKDNS
ncbi:uncharacterized protein [Anabrus simplex]|uniref:uncharacterized protein n=1 Tax=Anabrus simplex TaxID=316456 RepID=UPI0034DD25D8